MAATVHLCFDTNPRLTPDKQGANALRTVGFVRRQAHQIYRQLAHVDVNPASRLGCVNMKHHAVVAADSPYRRNVLDHTDLIVDKHHAGQNGVGPNGGFEHREVKQAVGLHIKVAHLKALTLELAAGVEHRLVLGLDGDDVFTLAFVKTRRSLDRQVVGLGCTRGPDNLARVSADQGGNLFTCFFYGSFCLPAPGVAARGRVTKMLPQPGNHGVHHPVVARVGGAVIHVNREMRSRVHEKVPV